jgi:hypothetical protein
MKDILRDVNHTASVQVTEHILVSKETKEELNKKKVIPRESYDSVINRLLSEVKKK